VSIAEYPNPECLGRLGLCSGKPNRRAEVNAMVNPAQSASDPAWSRVDVERGRGGIAGERFIAK
jgi:hypothetical protein